MELSSQQAGEAKTTLRGSRTGSPARAWPGDGVQGTVSCRPISQCWGFREVRSWHRLGKGGTSRYSRATGTEITRGAGREQEQCVSLVCSDGAADLLENTSCPGCSGNCWYREGLIRQPQRTGTAHRGTRAQRSLISGEMLSVWVEAFLLSCTMSHLL